MIEKNQKSIILNEAVEKGLRSSNILSIREIYDDIIGISDIGVRKYGNPLTPLYYAKPGELIEIGRISSYFNGLARDVRVANISVQELESLLSYINSEIWIRSQQLKIKANEVSKAANTQKLKSIVKAVWAFSESFNNTDNIDMTKTTVWIDTATGTCFLPNNDVDQSLTPSRLKVIEESVPTGSQSLGSNSSLAWDGLNTTNWRALFTDTSYAQSTVEIDAEERITAITIDPVGYGLTVGVDVFSENNWFTIINAQIYNKKTYPVDKSKVTKVRVRFTSNGTTLPAVAGIRNIILYTTQSSKVASLYSKELISSQTFSELKVDYSGTIPPGSEVNFYFSTSSEGPWTSIPKDIWKNVTPSITNKIAINPHSSINYGGLHSVSVGNIALSDTEGFLEVGTNQVEISAFRKNWGDEGETSHFLTNEDFKNYSLLRTWSDVNYLGVASLVIQSYGSSTLSSNGFTRGNKIIISRLRTGATYKDLCFVPLAGNISNNLMQPSNNYRFRFKVYCTKEFYFKDGLYWILQGFKAAGAKPFKDLAKTYTNLTMKINDTIIIRDDVPYTLYQDGTTEVGTYEATPGKNFSFNLKEGWNDVEIYISIPDTTLLGTDINELGDPYSQINIYPNFFDPAFQRDYNITSILATGQQNPITEFDLLWTVPKSPAFWAWNEERNRVLFNINSVKEIDSYFRGSLPTCILNYRAVNTTDVLNKSIYIKVDIERNESTWASSVLEDYKVLVK